MINAVANLAERYEYTPYGGRTVYRYDAWRGVRGDMDGNGDVDYWDADDFEAALSGIAATCIRR